MREIHHRREVQLYVVKKTPKSVRAAKITYQVYAIMLSTQRIGTNSPNVSHQ